MLNSVLRHFRQVKIGFRGWSREEVPSWHLALYITWDQGARWIDNGNCLQSSVANSFRYFWHFCSLESVCVYQYITLSAIVMRYRKHQGLELGTGKTTFQQSFLASVEVFYYVWLSSILPSGCGGISNASESSALVADCSRSHVSFWVRDAYSRSGTWSSSHDLFQWKERKSWQTGSSSRRQPKVRSVVHNRRVVA